jgi:hypothetical protein
VTGRKTLERGKSFGKGKGGRSVHTIVTQTPEGEEFEELDMEEYPGEYDEEEEYEEEEDQEDEEVEEPQV